MRQRTAYCSFCRKPYREVGPLVEGPGDVYICGGCVELSQSIIDQEKRRRGRSAGPAARRPTPEEIAERLSRFGCGHYGADHPLAAAAHAHFERGRRGRQRGPSRADRGCVLLIGPSPGSRLLLTRALAHLFDVPFAHPDASVLCGAERAPLLWHLLESSFPVETAAPAVLYVEGADRPDVQPPLLELLEGTTLEGTITLIPPSRAARGPVEQAVRIDTGGVLFVCGGTFAGLDELIGRRGRHAEQPVTGEDLIAFGMARGVVGRLQAVVRVGPLAEETLARIVSAVDPKALSGEGA